jgi:proline iminopeptidase
MHIEVNGVRLFIDVIGSGLVPDGPSMHERPTLILLHGGPGFDHSGFRPWFDRFADQAQVIYVDHRGNGRSGGSLDTCTLNQWGDDIKGLCDTLGVVKPIVFGNSFGGMVAMNYAIRHPEHPAKLVLSSTAARMNWPETFARFERLGGAQALSVAKDFWSAMDEAADEAYARICMPLYTRNPTSMAQSHQRAIRRLDVARHFSLGEMLSMDMRGHLPEIACPTMIWAGLHDPITPPSCAQEILDCLPPGHGRLEVFDDAGHGAYRDEPEKAEALLRAFISA